MSTALPSGIHGLSNIRRLPRLGKIRLGEKRKNAQGKEYPAELEYFRFDPESLKRYPAIVELYGEEPKELDVFCPVEDPAILFPQRYKLYGKTHGLKCTGNGLEATQFLCAKCGEMDCRCKNAARVDSPAPQCPCDRLERNICRPVASLMVILPKIQLGGVWQIDTGSLNSIIDVNSAIALPDPSNPNDPGGYVRALTNGRVSWIPLKLRRVPRKTHGGGVASTHYTLQLTCEVPMETILAIREGAPPTQYLIEAPRDQGDDLPALLEGAVETEAEPVKPGHEQVDPQPEPEADPPITAEQVERLKALRKDKALTAQDWTEHLGTYGVTSGADLTEAQAVQLIAWLEKSAPNTTPKDPAPVTPAFDRDAALREIKTYADKAKDKVWTDFHSACDSLGIEPTDPGKTSEGHDAGDSVIDKLLSMVRDLKDKAKQEKEEA